MKIQCVICSTTKGVMKQVRRFNSSEEFVICIACKRNHKVSRVETLAVWHGKSWGAEMIM